ncbi:uncharacterized protein LOC114195915 [Vigna unguiculata]|uniref:Uncharacterized protein n=1 Tax=Vigna unguiculata TaxID=3917 RepID=A0A4D6ME08_VIGUN|nr:uncharacterized protein LOC114195915 [Vigna unguiculata]QCD98266.1 hypothetical protein DEO72_LG6g2984 [Vigna unguiculata]
MWRSSLLPLSYLTATSFSSGFELEEEDKNMEGISGGLKKYWRRSIRGYQRLHGLEGRERETVQLGEKRRRRRWRIKINPKMKIRKISSPKKLVLWVRDAYMRMMLGLASSTAASAVGYGGGGSTSANGVFDRGPPPKEYDQKMIVHMYKTLIMAQGQLLPRDPTPNRLTTMVTTIL